MYACMDGWMEGRMAVLLELLLSGHKARVLMSRRYGLESLC